MGLRSDRCRGFSSVGSTYILRVGHTFLLGTSYLGPLRLLADDQVVIIAKWQHCQSISWQYMKVNASISAHGNTLKVYFAASAHPLEHGYSSN